MVKRGTQCVCNSWIKFLEHSTAAIQSATPLQLARVLRAQGWDSPSSTILLTHSQWNTCEAPTGSHTSLSLPHSAATLPRHSLRLQHYVLWSKRWSTLRLLKPWLLTSQQLSWLVGHDKLNCNQQLQLFTYLATKVLANASPDYSTDKVSQRKKSWQWPPGTYSQSTWAHLKTCHV